MKNTNELYTEINSGKWESNRAKTYKEQIRKSLIYAQNKQTQKQINEKIPGLRYTSGLVEKLKYTAKEVSTKFSKPTEIIGVLSGKKIRNNMYLTDYHIFKNQICNDVKSKAEIEGTVQMYKYLKKQKINFFDIAHSHNVMEVFHSPDDDNMLKNETRTSNKDLIIDVCGKIISTPYSVSTVFNEKGELFVKGGILVPVLTETGIVKKYRTFKPEFEVVKYGEIFDSDKRRLKYEIKNFVEYKDVI